MVGPRKLRGRDPELATLDAALGQVERGHSVVAFIEGEAGIGKTALLDAVETSARRRGVAVWRTKSEELESGRPFGTLLAMVGPTENQLSSLARLEMPPSSPSADAGWIDVPESRFRAIDGLIEAVEAATGQGALAVLVDDLQWIDELSLHAIRTVTRRLADRPLFLGLAGRPTTPTSEVARMLVSDDAALRLTLEPLSDDSVAELVADVVGPDHDPRALAAAARGSGNPFFILALLEFDGRDPEPGSGSVAGTRGPPIPDSLRRAVLGQFRQLPPESQQLVQLASVLGTSFSADSLSGASDRSMPSMFAAVDAAIHARFLVDAGGRIAFRHDLTRAIVYESLPPSLRSGLHLDIGRRLLALDVPARDAAAHFLRGAELGDADAADVLRKAARELGRGAPATATELLERALALLPEDHPQHAVCRGELIESYVFSAEVERSGALAEELLSSSPPVDVELSLRNARSQVFFLQGSARRAAEEFEAMVPLVAGRSREAVLLADAAVAAMFAIDLDRARHLATRSLTLARHYDDSLAPALGNGVLAWMAALSGDLRTGRELAEEAIRSANKAPGVSGHRRIPHLFHAQVLLWADEVEDARRSLQRGRALSSELGMGWDEPMYQALLADERIRAGELDDALAEAEAGLLRGDDVGSHFADGWLHAHRARVHLLRGDTEEANRELSHAETSLRHGGGQGLDQVWLGRGLLAAHQGDDDTALLILETLWDKLADLGTILRQLEMAPELLRIALRRERSDIAAKVLAVFDRPVTALPLADSTRSWCKALVYRDPTLGLDAVAALGTRNAPVDVARCRVDVASLLAGEGRAREAEAQLRDAGRFFDEIGAPFPVDVHARPRGGGHSVPARRQRDTLGWASLTKSERRIVELVGQGRTNAQIAKILSVSRRTVESHLHHAYPKLGLSSRVELAVLVARGRGSSKDMAP